MSYYRLLRESLEKTKSLLCVGLDPLMERMPEGIDKSPDGMLQFCQKIVSHTAPFCCAFKPQIAYFSAVGAENELQKLIAFIKFNHPQHQVILDAKRGDIGATATQYAREAFHRYKADAVTLNAYLGWDSIAPFAEYADRGSVIVCRSSNPSAGDLQDLGVSSDRVFMQLAKLALEKWNKNKNILLVAGATYPQELRELRSLSEEVPLLLPGIGAQGGTLETALRSSLNKNKAGVLVAASRSILYASNGKDYAKAAGREAQKLHESIEEFRVSF